MVGVGYRIMIIFVLLAKSCGLLVWLLNVFYLCWSHNICLLDVKLFCGTVNKLNKVVAKYNVRYLIIYNIVNNTPINYLQTSFI